MAIGKNAVTILKQLSVLGTNTMLQRQNNLALSILATALCLTTSNAHADLLLPNGDFEGYENASPGMPIGDAIPPTWTETGVGGHTFLVTESGELNGFLAFEGLPGGIDEDPQIPYAAQINGFGNGIHNSFSSIPGQYYIIDFVFGVLAPGSIAEIEIFMYDGPDTTGLLLDNFSFVADPDIYGDGEATGSYLFAVTADSGITTLLFKLDNSLGVGEDVMYLDSVWVNAVVPEPSAFWVVCLVASVALGRRRRFLVG